MAGNKVILDKYDGIVETFEYDHELGAIWGKTQNVQPHLDNAQQLRNDTDGYSPSRDIKHVADIPLALYDEWLIQAWRQGIQLYHKPERDKWLKKKLEDHRKLLTSGKSVRTGYGKD